MELIIDARETSVIPFFQEYKEIKITVKQLQIGDYAICKDDTLLCIIERKNWIDLAGSMCDGRKDNVRKLLKAREETGCKILYLIEGKARPANKKIGRIPFKNLQSHLDHLIMRDNIFLIYSVDYKDSAARLIEFIYNIMSLRRSAPPAVPPLGNAPDAGMAPDADMPSVGGNVAAPDAAPSDTNEVIFTKINKTDMDIIYSIWCCVPQITTKTASLFLNKYHISDLLLGKISKKEIAAMKYPSGNVIGKRARIIHNITHEDASTFKSYCKMLTCINGITANTAKLLIEKYGFLNIVRGQVRDLATFQKTSKTKLGKKIAEDIAKFFIAG